jgi:putative endonuclease
MVEHAAVILAVSGCRFGPGKRGSCYTGYSLYILKSVSTGTYYIGPSEDPSRRLRFHNSVEKGFTARNHPWVIIFEKEFSSRKIALRAEKNVKSWKNKSMAHQ